MERMYKGNEAFPRLADAWVLVVMRSNRRVQLVAIEDVAGEGVGGAQLERDGVGLGRGARGQSGRVVETCYRMQSAGGASERTGEPPVRFATPIRPILLALRVSGLDNRCRFPARCQSEHRAYEVMQLLRTRR